MDTLCVRKEVLEDDFAHVGSEFGIGGEVAEGVVVRAVRFELHRKVRVGGDGITLGVLWAHEVSRELAVTIRFHFERRIPAKAVTWAQTVFVVHLILHILE